MSELFYTFREEKGELIVSIEEAKGAPKRFLYPDTLQRLAGVKGREVVDLLTAKKRETDPCNEVKVPREKVWTVVKLLGATGNLFWKGVRLFVDPLSMVDLFFHAESDEQGRIHLTPSLPFDFAFAGESTWIISQGVVKQLKENIDVKWLRLPSLLPEEEKETFLEAYEGGEPPRAPRVIWKTAPPQKSSPQPYPVLVLKDKTGGFANLSMDYGAHGKVAMEDLQRMAFRNVEAEKHWEKDLLETSYQKKRVGETHYYCPLDQVGKSLSFLLEIGWTVIDHRGRRVVRQTGEEVSYELDCQVAFLKGGLHYGDHQADLGQVMGAFNRREQFVDLTPGVVGLLDQRELTERFGDLTEGEPVVGGVRISRSLYGLFEGLSAKMEEKIIFSPPDAAFQGTLHPYQQEGVNWLSFLETEGFHGLLADEMGLGKTVQTLAFLSRIKRSHPVLIIMPTSLLFNWRREIEKFLPHMAVRVHSGPDRTASSEELQSSDIVLTSYALLRQDILLLQKVVFSCLILDEAQAIKNPDSQVAEAACSLKGACRLVITGTPIENRLEDLWSLFHFLDPSLLGERKAFQAELAAGEVDSRWLAAIQKKLRPFVLRRRKEDVAIELPEKIEQTIWIEMEADQRALYEDFLRKSRSGLLKKIDEGGTSAYRMEILEAILRLRQICCHPLLVDGNLESTQSQKLERLMEDLEEVVQEGRKAIVYSQFSQMLRLIERRVRERGWKMAYLDGRTRNREAIVQNFQEDPSLSLFLISLKAGGVGLNLTAADYVILFDPWWNFAVESQAIDRAHRLGRTKAVFARRYLIANSIEEKMEKLKIHKATLSQGLLDIESLNLEDLKSLLSD